jgi:hypothetical protein
MRLFDVASLDAMVYCPALLVSSHPHGKAAGGGICSEPHSWGHHVRGGGPAINIVWSLILSGEERMIGRVLAGHRAWTGPGSWRRGSPLASSASHRVADNARRFRI